MSQSQPLVSIIVPVYNAEKHLKKCLDSILIQTYEKFELILINDGSTDNSGKICENLSENDKRIKYILTNNFGASHARNIGLNYSSGELIWFIDADDWIDSQALENLISEMIDDILFFGFKKVRQNINNTCKILKESIFHITDTDNCLSYLFTTKDAFLGFTWNKLFRNDIIIHNKIRFNENLIIKEDEVFTLEYCKHVKSIGISSLCPYYYRVLCDSVSHSKNIKRNMFQLAESIDNIITTIPNYPNLRKVLINANKGYYLRSIIENIDNEQTSQIINKCINFNKKNYDILDFTFKQRLLFSQKIYVIRFVIKIYLKISKYVSKI